MSAHKRAQVFKLLCHQIYAKVCTSAHKCARVLNPLPSDARESVSAHKRAQNVLHLNCLTWCFTSSFRTVLPGAPPAHDGASPSSSTLQSHARAIAGNLPAASCLLSARAGLIWCFASTGGTGLTCECQASSVGPSPGHQCQVSPGASPAHYGASAAPKTPAAAAAAP
eukprot:scaffold18972_cov21-Tisochrysis_lutea.AAC.1